MTEALYISLLMCFLVILGTTWKNHRKEESKFKKDWQRTSQKIHEGFCSVNEARGHLGEHFELKHKPRLWKTRSSETWICNGLNRSGFGSTPVLAYTDLIHKQRGERNPFTSQKEAGFWIAWCDHRIDFYERLLEHADDSVKEILVGRITYLKSCKSEIIKSNASTIPRSEPIAGK